jgi:hypothetical protein
MIGKTFHKGRKYTNFPRNAGAETFMLFGTTTLKNFMGDGRIRKIKRHEKYDEMWVQFGYFQKRKWLVAIFPNVRQMISMLQENDNIHVFGTTDRWGSRRVYIIYGFIKFPMPSIRQVEDFSLGVELDKLQKSDEENELSSYIANAVNQRNFKSKEILEEGNIEDDDKYIANNDDDG